MDASCNSNSAAGSEMQAAATEHPTVQSGSKARATSATETSDNSDASSLDSSEPQSPALHGATERQGSREQVTLGILLAVTLFALAWRGYRLATYQPASVVIEKASDDVGYRIDLNTATWIELSQLEGVGPVLAKRIVDDRQRDGPFISVEDLQRVSGIGPRTVERNQRWMQVTVLPGR